MKLQRNRRDGLALSYGRVDRQALGFVLLSLAASTAWIGIYAAITAKAIGLI
jgi:hypothetical protein